jgi:hypothetical protein
MQQRTQRLIGVIVAIASAMVFIYGAFYFAAHSQSDSLNAPLWLGVGYVGWRGHAGARQSPRRATTVSMA